MIQQIRSLPPHDTKNTVSMNEARNIVIMLSKPMAEILNVIDKTKKEGEDTKKLIENADADILDFEKNLHFKAYSLKTTYLDYPKTVCTHKDCVKYVPVGQSRTINTVYVTECHAHCYLNGIPKETTNNPDLSDCKAFNCRGDKCIICQHDYKIHMHITYSTKPVLQDFLSPEAQKNIAEKGSVKEKKKEFLKQLEAKINELEYEKMVIMESAAKFATFMKNSAMIPYNDSFIDYLDYLISDEENKSRELRDDGKIQRLKENKNTYSENIRNLKKAIASGSDVMIDPQKIYEMKAKLMKLKHYGKTLESIIGNKY